MPLMMHTDLICAICGCRFRHSNGRVLNARQISDLYCLLGRLRLRQRNLPDGSEKRRRWNGDHVFTRNKHDCRLCWRPDGSLLLLTHNTHVLAVYMVL